MKIETLEGSLNACPEARFCIVVARWNQFVVNQLEAGALDTLQRQGVEQTQITIVRVPGAFEIPLVLDKVATQGRYDAIIALGAVIRGGTPHFDYVAGECVSGITQAMTKHSVPISFGVLTVDNLEQAIERAGSKAGNKGSEAAACAIEMVNLMRVL